MNKKERNLKVYYANQDRAGGAGYYSRRNEQVPTIILKGKWLEQYGFSISDHIKVVCENEMLIIKKIDQD